MDTWKDVLVKVDFVNGKTWESGLHEEESPNVISLFTSLVCI
jgi:hypothetical protein